jgi:hypothetical protein
MVATSMRESRWKMYRDLKSERGGKVILPVFVQIPIVHEIKCEKETKTCLEDQHPNRLSVAQVSAPNPQYQ